MRRTAIYILITVAALAIITGAILIFRGRSRPLIRASTPPQDVEAVLAYSIDELSAGISAAFSTDKRGALSSRFLAFDLHRASDPVFPDDYQLRAEPDNPGLIRYVAIDPQSRKGDFYITPPVTGPPDAASDTDYYWDSEYQSQGQPVKFRCSFVIHLEPQSASVTKISILEYRPEVWVGKEFDLLGHGGPGFYRDIRIVQPTNKDRVELLDLIILRFPEKKGST